MKKTNLLAILALLLVFGRISLAAPGDLLQTFLNPTPAASDYFGWSVAGVGDKILAGTGNAGAAYLFDANGTLLLTFLNPTPESYDWFGEAVAGVGEDVLVASPHESSAAYSAGAVYLFDGSTGALLRTFQNPSPQVEESFGASVAAMGNKVLIGAPGNDTGGNYSGAAHLFDVNGTFLRTFTNPTPAAFDCFGGQAVGWAGNNVLVGCRYDNDSAGAVYIFSSSSGSLLQSIPNPSSGTNDFGISVAGVGNNVLVGAQGESSSGMGAAYLFDGSTGGLLQTFPNPDPCDWDWFGAEVSAVGSRILISARNACTGANNTGTAYLFDSEGVLLCTLLNPTPEDNDNFGWCLAAVGNNILVGAGWDNTGADNSGAAYLIEGPLPADFEADGDIDLIDYAALASAWRSAPGGPLWNRACDISDPIDNVIDGLDLAVFADNWQK